MIRHALALALSALAAPVPDVAPGERWVRLVDARTGEALVGARVRGLASTTSFPPTGATPAREAGAGGFVRLPGAAELYVAEAEGCGPITFLPELAREDRDAAPTLALDAGARLEVRVLGADGRPVEGATVDVECATYALLERSPITRLARPLIWSARVDDGGVARLLDLPSEARLELCVAVGSQRTEVDDRLVLAPGARRVVDAHVGVARPVEGRALHDDGTPAVGVELSIRRRGIGTPRLKAGRSTVVTDEAGHFRFEGVRPGLVWLGAAPTQGVAPATAHEVPAVGPGAALELVVPHGAPLAGRAVDADGRALEGVYVSARREPDGSALSTRTDADGRFRFERLTDGRYRVRAQRNGAGYGEAWARPGDPEVRVQMRPTGALEGVVVDPSGDEVRYDELAIFGPDHHSGSSGSADPRFEASDLVPGEYHVVAVCADGRVGVTPPLRVTADERTEAPPLVLAPGGLVTVRGRGHAGYARVRCIWDGRAVAGDNLLAGTHTTFAVPTGEVVVELNGSAGLQERRVEVAAGVEVDVAFD